MADRSAFPVVGSITGNRHFTATNVLTGGHSEHPLQRAGLVAGNIAPVVPGQSFGVGIGGRAPAAGPNLHLPSLIDLNPIGNMSAPRV